MPFMNFQSFKFIPVCQVKSPLTFPLPPLPSPLPPPHTPTFLRQKAYILKGNIITAYDMHSIT